MRTATTSSSTTRARSRRRRSRPCSLRWASHPPDLHSFPTRRSSDLLPPREISMKDVFRSGDSSKKFKIAEGHQNGKHPSRSEERFSRNAETDLVCRLLLEKKKETAVRRRPRPEPNSPSRGRTAAR